MNREENCIMGIECKNLLCKICKERTWINIELRSDVIPKRVCHECYEVFELDKTNPFGEILFDKQAGVYFECDKCFTLESDCNDMEDIDDIEDRIDQMAELQRFGRI